jgi:hypothetical protein
MFPIPPVTAVDDKQSQGNGIALPWQGKILPTVARAFIKNHCIKIFNFLFLHTSDKVRLWRNSWGISKSRK